MKKEKKKIWFPAKTYGVGWGFPSAWQGWVVMLSYFLLLIIGFKFLTASPVLVPFFIMYVLVMTGILLFVCWKKGEKNDFRWGKKK
jgi:hypothetical protein